MSFYGEMADTVIELLREFGTVMQLNSPARDVLGARFKTAKHENNGVQTGDVKFYLEASAEPRAGERLTPDPNSPDEYILGEPEPIKPATEVVAWVVYGRLG